MASAPEAKPTPPKASTKAASAPSAKVPAKESAKAATKSFYINVGLFGVPENAAKAHAKMLEAGLPSVMKELKSPWTHWNSEAAKIQDDVLAPGDVAQMKARGVF